MRDVGDVGSFHQSCAVASAMMCMCTTLGSWQVATGTSAGVFLTELVVLQISLALIAPRNVSKLYRHKHAERSLVTLEWMKAYVGRLLGPITALVVHNTFGFGPLLALLFVGSFAVAATA